jgi:hypothetical protein
MMDLAQECCHIPDKRLVIHKFLSFASLEPVNSVMALPADRFQVFRPVCTTMRPVLAVMDLQGMALATADTSPPVLL